ncbi:NAD(P)/FAD-dependent oxidoreductase [Paenarthrobacter sp. NPDC090522]|uniref:NAD(P)/FAD-dependent oxidoreductase n=1 Tax=Paenarthrobacter sp. NPDC090522 TaxID=3364383 RepID=UPI00381A275C
MTMRRIVVVGNGIAGQTACEALRGAGFDGELTVVGSERHRPYSRPALSKALLHGDDDGNVAGWVRAHQLPEPAHGAAELLGVSASGLDADARLVMLDDGSRLPYDGLVIASGARPKQLPGTPDDAANVLTLRTLEDAGALKRRVSGRPSVIVVGGGPLGMEVASGCLHAGCDVTLVSDARPLSKQLGHHLAGIFTTAALARGLKLAGGGPARLLEGSKNPDGGARVALADGIILEADLVAVAIGDQPNTGWLANSGLLVDGTLRADSRGRVRPDVVAAGDVAFIPTRQGLRRVPLWTSAIDQAKAAAVGLLLGDAAPELDVQPYFWTEGFGLSLKVLGPTPVIGEPAYCEPGQENGSLLMRWADSVNGGTAAAINYRIPIPKLRRLARSGPVADGSRTVAAHR